MTRIKRVLAVAVFAGALMGTFGTAKADTSVATPPAIGDKVCTKLTIGWDHQPKLCVPLP